MSERARARAARFEAANDDAIAFVEGVSDEGWNATRPGERCTVAALACHVGASHDGPIVALVRPIAEGMPGPRFTPDDPNAMNAEHARTKAAATQEQALTLLREGGARAAACVRGLDDGQLDRSGPLPFSPKPMTAAAAIEAVPIGHPVQHLASMRAATA